MRGRHLTRAIKVRVPNNRVDVFSGQGHAFDSHITEAVEREFRDEDPLSLDHENVRTFRGSISFGIEPSFMEDFRESQGDSTFEILWSLDFRDTGEVLPEVVNRLALGRMEDVLDGETFDVSNGLAGLRNKNGGIEIPLLDMQFLSRRNEILMLPIIDSGRTDKTFLGFPRKVRGDDFVSDREFRERGGFIPIADVVTLA